jgi:hypothetical protein
LRDQALREQANYEQRLNQLANERDSRARETEAAQTRFAEAMARISEMQMQLAGLGRAQAGTGNGD